MSRRKWKSFGLVSVLGLSVLTAACGGGEKQAEEPVKTENPQQSEAPATVEDGPFTKYDPPIEVHAIRNSLSDDRFKNGDTLQNNAWTKEYESALGVKLIYDWTATADGGDESAFNQKLNVAIASDELPDILKVNMKQLNQLVEADQIQDMTEVFNKYVSPDVKNIANQDGGLALKSATFDGKLMAIPMFGGNITGADVIWIRTDWLTKLKLSPPKTMDDLLKISEAFTTQDPDGNGKADTFGLAITKDIYGGVANLTGFFNGFHAFPNIWVKDAAGQIVYGNVQPEMKAALAVLQEMYKKGQIDREFAVKDGGKVTESISQNKVGIQIGANWNSYYPLNDAIKQNPGMDWKPYPIVSIDDKPAQPGLGFPVYEFAVAKKSFKHPEVIVKLLNLQNERLYGKTADWEKFSVAKDGTEIFQYPFVLAFPPNKDVPDNYEAIKQAFATNDASKLNPEQKANYEKILAFRNGDASQWAVDRQAGPDGSAFAALAQYRSYAVTTSFLGASTPTMVTKKGTLDKMEKEAFTKIIMGSASIDEFDKFVEQWKKLGGDQMTKEVNEWNAAQ